MTDPDLRLMAFPVSPRQPSEAAPQAIDKEMEMPEATPEESFDDDTDDGFPPYGEPLPDTAFVAARSVAALVELFEALERELQEAHGADPQAADRLLQEAILTGLRAEGDCREFFRRVRRADHQALVALGDAGIPL